MSNKKQELIEAAYSVVAENGLNTFSMRQITKKIGVSEALIYKHFENKEHFLYCCFEEVHKGIAELFQHMPAPNISSIQDILNLTRYVWFTYFDYLIQNGDKTVFYFEYRQSPYIAKILENDEEARQSYFSDFVSIFETVKIGLGIDPSFNEDVFWAFILDVTGQFAIRIVNRQLPDSLETKEQIWSLISRGALGLMKGEH